MSIKSMTGFARVQGTRPPLAWHWEVRSVNGRSLDVRLRLPPGFEDLDPEVRKLTAAKLARGSLNITLTVKKDETGARVRVNPDALRDVMASIDLLTREHGAAPPRADGILALRGVLESADPEPEDSEVEDRRKALLGSFDTALDAIVLSRAEEGARLQSVLSGSLDAISEIGQRIDAAPARRPEAVRGRLAEQLKRILDASVGLDETRLYQEAALLAVRGDVEEELKRLAAHVESARDLLRRPEPVGRRLDFLAQEFNREANTLCSKSSDTEITRLGLELKAVIDQMREQIQNIE